MKKESRTRGRIPGLIGVLLGMAFAAPPALAVLGPQYFDYQVGLPNAPTNSGDAIATLDAREQAVLAAIACGDQLEFARDSVQHEAGEDTASRLLAKVEWGGGHADSQMHLRIATFCRYSRTFRWLDFANKEVCALLFDAATCIDPDDDSDDDAKKAAAEAFEKAARENAADQLWAELVNGKLDTLKNKVLDPVNGGRACRTEFIPTEANNGVTVDRSIAGWRRVDPIADGNPKIDPAVTSPVRAGAIQIDFAVSQDCLVRQAAIGLSALTIPVRDGEQQRAGTNGAPCHGFGTIYGDWDMAERNLVRVAYLIRKYGLGAEGQTLHDANAHLRNDLLTLDRGPEGDSHNVWFGCGNSTGHSGAPEDRAIDRNGHDNPPGDALGDLGWFLLMLLLLLALLAAALALAAALGLLGLGALAAAGVVVVVGVFLFNIPETENHLLGINTTKYLNNQLIIEDLGNDLGMTAPYIDDQIELKAWLLKRMQGFVQNDFIEYNAHPYQRHSIESIRNIFDYAGDPGRPTIVDADLRNAAQLVLDYTSAKFAVGSDQGRRMVPYRRHRSDLAKTIDADASGWNGMYDLSGGADHQVGLGLLYSGQTQQLPLGQGSRGFAAEVINATASDYIPEETTLDLAIGRDVPIYQRIHHTTEEIYSSGSGFLVSAGGLATGLAYPVTGIAFFDGHKDDWGSGVPTTLFLNAAPGPNLGFLAPGSPADPDPAVEAQRELYKNQQALAGPGRAPPVWLVDHAGKPVQDDSSIDGIYAKYLTEVMPDAQIKSTLGEFIRIKGEYDVDFDGDDKLVTYDNNLCVFDGFACGTNIELGPMATDCSADASMPPWTFIDSQQCKGREDAPRTLIVVFRKDCPSGQDCTNYGFFEVIDADRYAAISNAGPGEDLFAKFRNQITSGNTALLTLPAGKNMVADYHSARGQKLEFSCWGHESDSDTWGVYHVDNVATHELDDWPFAGGEWSGAASLLRPEVQTPIRSSGDGVVEITSPRLRARSDPTRFRVLRLDFSDRDHPKAAVEN
jgi:hypothetical protein